MSETHISVNHDTGRVSITALISEAEMRQLDLSDGCLVLNFGDDDRLDSAGIVESIEPDGHGGATVTIGPV